MPTPRRRRKDQDPLNVVANTTVEPSHEDIARRAYQLYEDRGGEHGRDWQDWFQAERELQAGQGVHREIKATERPHVAA